MFTIWLIVCLILYSKEVAQFSPLSAECSSLLSKVTPVPLVIAEGEHESPEFKRQRAEYVKVGYTPYFTCIV